MEYLCARLSIEHLQHAEQQFQNIQVLIPGTCGYIIWKNLCGKRDFADALEIGRLFWILWVGLV